MLLWVRQREKQKFCWRIVQILKRLKLIILMTWAISRMKVCSLCNLQFTGSLSVMLTSEHIKIFKSLQWWLFSSPSLTYSVSLKMTLSWTEFEHIIIVYFALRKASYEVCTEVLHLKSMRQTTVTQSLITVWCKLNKSKEIPELWDSIIRWNTSAVNNWLMQQSKYVKDFQAVMSVEAEELIILKKVNTSLSSLKCYCH